jgi:hypothetical protein
MPLDDMVAAVEREAASSWKSVWKKKRRGCFMGKSFLHLQNALLIVALHLYVIVLQ